MINMILDGLPVDFELDTGAAVTVMSEEKFGQLFPGHPFERSSIEYVSTLASGFSDPEIVNMPKEELVMKGIKTTQVHKQHSKHT